MDEMIRGDNTSYARYEELITRRDNLRKEAFQYHRAYVREFGDLILEVFRKKIVCIQKKKTIEYCQAALNHGKVVDQKLMQEYLQKEMSRIQSCIHSLSLRIRMGHLSVKMQNLTNSILRENMAQIHI